MRKEINLNAGWLFHKGDLPVETPADKGPVYSQCKTERKQQGPASYNYLDTPNSFSKGDREFNSKRWVSVDLPHDYVVGQNTDENENNALGYLHYDNAWYRKHFTLDPADRECRFTLRFDGITGKSTVYLNGCLMYHNFSSYNTFEIDITDYVFFDKENIIAVYVNTDEFEGWWYQGGGIYRNVFLTVTAPVAIDLYGVYAPYKKINDAEWQIDFETTIINSDFDPHSIVAESTLYDDQGNKVVTARGSTIIELREKATVKYSASITDPELWDTAEPNLYKIETKLYENGNEIDSYDTRIGFRTIEFSPEGFFLNGKKTFINGVCAHQDVGLFGLAVPDNIAKYKMRLIKEMGANGYRTSHYQQTASYLDACDELGLLVMDEARWFESTKEAFDQLESLVKRDRNRPSVIMWSTSNEEPFHITENGRKLHRAIAAQIRKLDRTRPITVAEDKTPDKSTIYDHCDIVGINYNLKIYDKVHEMLPGNPVFASECCATGTTRDWFYPTDMNGRIRDLDIDTNSWFSGREKTYKFLRERDYVFGCFQWAAVEHRGEAAWPRICSSSGALDIYLQKKGAFYQNKSHWTNEPMVHILPHWNFKGLEGTGIPVTVYTNCEEVELFLNGKSLGRKQIEKYGHGEWIVDYTEGTLTAVGFEQGRKVVIDERKTTGKAVGLKLSSENSFNFNGHDVALFTCESIDENGLAVPDADETVTFSVNSPAVIVGTGSDNCDHNNVMNTERKMYMGKISVAVLPSKNQNEIVLTAKSSNCRIAQIVIQNQNNIKE